MTETYIITHIVITSVLLGSYGPNNFFEDHWWVAGTILFLPLIYGLATLAIQLLINA